MAPHALVDPSDALSEPFLDSYKQYKSDTNVFTTWLANIGQKCGYKLSAGGKEEHQSPLSAPQSRKPRLKGKARKEARNAAQNEQSSQQHPTKTLPLRDFIPLAKHIVSFSKPKVVVPRPVIKRLERAIDLRLRCASRYVVRVQETASLPCNESHQHFIKVLQMARDLLKPLYQNPTSPQGETATASGKGDHKRNDEPLIKLQNRFESLTFELEGEEEDLETLSQLADHETPGKKSSMKKDTSVPEQQSREEDFQLACFCFFQDLRDIRNHLQDLWRRYEQKQVTLVVASLVTNTAIDFVRRVEEDFRAKFIGSEPADYFDIFIDKMFRQACTARGHPFSVQREPFKTDQLLDKPLYADEMADEADSIMLPIWYVLKYCTNLSWNGIEVDSKDQACSMPTVTEDLWRSFETEPKYIGRKGQQEFNALLLHQMTWMLNDPADVLGEDSFIGGLREMKITAKVSTWLVFATQNFLDIQHILREHTSRCSKELHLTCEIIRDRAVRHVNSLEIIGEKQREKEDCIRLEGYLSKFFSHHFEETQKAFSIHPFGAGLREFYTIASFRQHFFEGKSMIDFLDMAHLYHAAKLHSPSMVWPDMEFVIATHTPEYLFVGGRPTSVDQCGSRLNLALGAPIPSRDPLSSRQRPTSRAGKIRLPLADDIPFSCICLARETIADHHVMERTASNLELALNASMHGIAQSKFKLTAQGTLIDRVELLKLTRRKPKGTVRQLLSVMEEKLALEAPALYFDNWTFRITCSALLRLVCTCVFSRYIRVARTHFPIYDVITGPTAPIIQELLAGIDNMRSWEEDNIEHLQVSLRIQNEIVLALAPRVTQHGSCGVDDLAQFGYGLVAQSYQSRFGASTSSEDGTAAGGVGTTRQSLPTLSSMTEAERMVLRDFLTEIQSTCPL